MCKTIRLKRYRRRGRPLALAVTLPLLLIGFFSCKDAMLDPERFGSIHGVVLDESSHTPVPYASVTTTPPSEAIITDEEGSFRFEGLSVGAYTVSVRKSGYERTSVSVMVREERSSHATIMMKADSVASQD